MNRSTWASGKRISPLLLDRILRGQHEERRRQRVGGVPDRHLHLLHRLQERGLDLGRGAVDFVRQDDVGEQRSFARHELSVLLVVDHRADQVGGKKVGRELDALELRFDDIRQRLHRQRLGQAGDPFQQQVTTAQKADQQPVQERLLADDDLAHLAQDLVDEHRLFLDEIVDPLDVLLHRGKALRKACDTSAKF